MSGHGVGGWSTERQKSFQLGLCYWHPNYSAHLCAVLQDTRIWRKRAMKKSWWLTEVRQDGDTDHYQLLKATKRHIHNLCIVPRQEEPRKTSELVSLLSCGIAVDAGPSTIRTEADGQHGHHCLGAPCLYGLQSTETPWECEQKLMFLWFEVCSESSRLSRRRSGPGICCIDGMLQQHFPQVPTFIFLQGANWSRRLKSSAIYVTFCHESWWVSMDS